MKQFSRESKRRVLFRRKVPISKKSYVSKRGHRRH